MFARVNGPKVVKPRPRAFRGRSSPLNEFNAWKNGKFDDSPESENGTQGLHWRHEIAESVFECASVDVAQALQNWSDSGKGVRHGAPVGLVLFAATGRSTPSFRLRNRPTPIATQSIRFSDAHHLRLAKIGDVWVFGPTRWVPLMLEAGRFHVYSATLTGKHLAASIRHRAYAPRFTNS